jgi:hypothetical protein
VDSTGYKQGPLTANLAIASLTAMPLAAGGKPTSADAGTLDTMAVELMGYSGTRLAADAQAFAVTEFNYNPGRPGRYRLRPAARPEHPCLAARLSERPAARPAMETGGLNWVSRIRSADLGF